VRDEEHDRGGKLDVERVPLVDRDHHGLVLEHEVRRVADHGGRDGELVVVPEVHEDVAVAVLVEVLEVAAVDRREVDLRPGVERPVDDLAGHDVLQRGADECAALAGLHVLEVGDVPEPALEVEDGALLDVVRRGHAYLSR